MKSLDVDILRRKLKDIYFPYIQVCQNNYGPVFVLVGMCYSGKEVRKPMVLFTISINAFEVNLSEFSPFILIQIYDDNKYSIILIC